MKKLIPLALVILISVSFSCQKGTKKTTTSEVVTEVKNDIERIEPPHWWTGFNNTQVQLLVKHPNISEATPSINYAGVSIEKVHKADSPNYLFLDLNILESTKAGPFNIHFKFNEEKELVQTYEVKARLKEAADYQGFDSTDAIYLITPDRFANGDTSNDIKEDLKEKTINRKDDYARHGGDLRGIIQHLDYIQEMGFTQIWSCPLLTNDI